MKAKQLQDEIQALETKESHLKTQTGYLSDLNNNSKDRLSCLEEERKAMQDVIDTLTNQNKEILSELDEHVKAHEFVRKKLDRKQDVASLMNTFNRELVESRVALERNQSPLRQKF